MTSDSFNLETNYKFTPHMIILSLMFLFQYFSKSKEVRSNLNEQEKKKADKIFWKYLIVYQIAKASDWCLGPFVFEFFESYHNLKHESIAKLMAVSFMSSLFLGSLVVGYLNDRSNKKLPCMLYGIVLAISSLVRQIKSPFALIISQIAFGMSSSILYSSFENWFIEETNTVIKNKEVKDYLISAVFEKSMICDSITAVGISLIAGIFKKQYGITGPYMLSILISLVTIIISGILFTNNNCEVENTKNVSKKEEKYDIDEVLSNVKQSLIHCKNNPFIILIGLTESFLFVTLHIFIFIWTPVLKNLNPEADTSEIFTLFMLSLMLGGASFRAFYIFYDNNSFKVAKILSGLCTISFLIAYLSVGYNWTLYGFLVYEVSIGLFYPTYSKIKSEYLPSEVRGTLMNVFKIPFNFIVVILLITMNKLFTIPQFLLVNLFLASSVFLIHLFTFKKNKVIVKED